MMGLKSSKNVVRLEEVGEGQIPPLLERRAAKALDLLCDAVSSPAAKSNGSSEVEIINAIKKLKPSFEEPKNRYTPIKKLKSSSLGKRQYGAQYTPVWNISAKQELEQVGLDLKEIKGLYSILPLKKSSKKTNVSDQLIPEILFTLAILDYDEGKFRQFLSLLEKYPAVGVLLCEILTDSKLLEKAQKFLDRESTDQKREFLLEYLKGKLLPIYLQHIRNFNVVHFASSCGQYISTIVPKEINCISTGGESKVSESDATALATVISHSSVVKELKLFNYCLDCKSIASLQDGLKNSDVKIHFLDISDNDGIEEEGFCCLGKIVMKHAVEELNMSECGLSFGKLKSFDDTSGNAKIRFLVMEWNWFIEEEGFRCLGNIVKKHAVEELNMCQCKLSFGKLKLFDDTSGNAKIRSLNISGSDDINEEGVRCLGNIVKKHAVEELNMSGCGLAFGKLKLFYDTSGNAKIRSLDISSNRFDEEGFRCLGNIVKKHAVEELKISDCGLSSGKLKSFDDASENAKIKVLDISYNEDLAVNAICQLALLVTERLICVRYFDYWREQNIRELQDFIQSHHPGGLKVTLGDDLPELRSDIPGGNESAEQKKSTGRQQVIGLG